MWTLSGFADEISPDLDEQFEHHTAILDEVGVESR
jgi:hypothetical protein